MARKKGSKRRSRPRKRKFYANQHCAGPVESGEGEKDPQTTLSGAVTSASLFKLPHLQPQSPSDEASSKSSSSEDPDASGSDSDSEETEDL